LAASHFLSCILQEITYAIAYQLTVVPSLSIRIATQSESVGQPRKYRNI